MQRRWDHDLIVYNAGSGDTHLLETISAEIFIFLQDHYAALSQIITHIADVFHYEIDDELKTHITELIVQLEKLRLIEVAQS